MDICGGAELLLYYAYYVSESSSAMIVDVVFIRYFVESSPYRRDVVKILIGLDHFRLRFYNSKNEK